MRHRSHALPRCRRGAVALFTVALTVAAPLLVGATAIGASTATSAAAAKEIPAPAGLPGFYSVPQPLKGKPGTLLKSEKVDAPAVNGNVYRVMYLSAALGTNKPVAVTGLVAVPHGTAPKGGFPVVTWAHGTNGMADECAPSLKPNDTARFANLLLAQGWIITATDYRGEGTPGLMPYIAGETEARDTLDIVRAADHLPAAHASKDYVVWGHSQGGHSAVFAQHAADDYAPDLSLKGTVAGAPPSQFNLLYTFLKTSPFRYYLLMAGGGLNAAYGDKAAPLDEILTPAGIAALADLDTGCAGDLSKKYGAADISTFLTRDPFAVPAWAKLFTENDPQSFSTPASTPLLIIQGGADEQIPVASTKILADHLCGIGQNLERWIYPGASHAGVIAVSSGDMIRWMEQRFKGADTPDTIGPDGVPGIDVSGCAGSG
jgi:alpha-beta hydrolase superfamily lysophospholipase